MIEKTLIIIKPDAINRGLLGEIVQRFERKGLKIVAMKMMHLHDKLLEEHYPHIKDKPFFPGVKKFMQASPTVVLVLEGFEAVEVVRLMCGPTKASIAPAGTIRGDYALSVQSNVVHASDSKETAKKEIKRFFKEDEILNYEKIDYELILAPDERR
ncbi:nucleoside-diphosphate kinase [Candidatus Woesearchaeota archaeon]|nr:nucleoside-diphosphate kinase [Candidatus Woesearchaeota archaeon]